MAKHIKNPQSHSKGLRLSSAPTRKTVVGLSILDAGRGNVTAIRQAFVKLSRTSVDAAYGVVGQALKGQGGTRSVYAR